MIRATLAALSVVLPATLLTAGMAGAGEATPTHDMCRQEDGHGQRICVWDGRHPGVIGKSYIAIRGGTKDARYIYISHARAHRLTH